MFTNQSSQECQSRFFKQWHPDYIGSYNSLRDRHLKHFFQHPARRTHLNKNNQVTSHGKIINEREWRKQNIAWERCRREAEEQGELLQMRPVDSRRAKMELRQQQKDDDAREKKREETDETRDKAQEVKDAWVDQNTLLAKISDTNRSDVEHLINFLNFEIEYILRPQSAPIRYRGSPRLHTHQRAHSAKRLNLTSRYGYPKVTNQRSKSADRPPEQQSHQPIRNIEIPETQFVSSKDPSKKSRPFTAPPRSRPKSNRRSRLRSQSHPNYKEDEYLKTKVVLQYVGLSDPSDIGNNSRSRYKASRKRRRKMLALPSQIDEVTIVQQPRGSYVLEVFNGFIQVGETFEFTSRRVEGFPFSLTIYVNRQCHVRLSVCCEAKRAPGTRLGRGSFQLVEMEEPVPCLRCLVESDPVARKLSARISQRRGVYDRFGNRRPPSAISDQPSAVVKKSRSRKTRTLTSEGSESDDDLSPLVRHSKYRTPMRRKRNQLTPKSRTDNTNHNNAKFHRKSRPKSAPKHNGRQDDTGSPVPELDDYSSVADESSEEDIELSQRSNQNDERSDSESDSESSPGSKSEEALEDDNKDESDQEEKSKYQETKNKQGKNKIMKNKVR
ncbi:glutamate-rich protein 3-like [Tigriopus californicus]|uniref:glutamate-rich protein 3-like n=1 Tax=Tigriopus californicus TaxID=6832 RepID=UPI0027DA8D98|nr:glutamate-rich protein 3-like [Tigriopus californicus]